jgi:ligand-binding sensor domain-containing protein
MRTAILPFCLLLLSCNEASENTQKDKPVADGQAIIGNGIINATTSGNPLASINSSILSILQDKNGAYWLATNTEGLYRYDGKVLTHYTKKDGLGYDQVHEVKQGVSGDIYMSTGAGISRFDDKLFTNYTNHDLLLSHRSEHWDIAYGDVLFGAEGGIYRCRDTAITYLPLPKMNTSDKFAQSKSEAGPYTVYSILNDTKGNYWFGTGGAGMCRYDGHSFTWFNQQGIAGPPMLAMAEDRNGNIWLGNNGYGLLRWDGKSVANITDANGLSNDYYLKNKRVSDKPGTMARVWSIQEDMAGQLWMATVDAGVWCYNGKAFVNYTAKDGIPGGVVNTIYKDRNGSILFGTRSGVYTFNGVSFARWATNR